MAITAINIFVLIVVAFVNHLSRFRSFLSTQNREGEIKYEADSFVRGLTEASFSCGRIQLDHPFGGISLTFISPASGPSIVLAVATPNHRQTE